MNGAKLAAGGGSMSLGTILFVVFLILKLTGTVDWAWIWVFAPIWMPVVFVLSIVIVPLIVVLIIALIVSNR